MSKVVLDYQTPPQLKLGYRPEIDGLRAIAIIGVLTFHAFPNLLPGGFLGVDVFFVISGYLITSILQTYPRENSSIFHFYQSRARRLMPSLLTVISFVLLFGFGFLLIAEYVRVAQDSISGLLFLSNFQYWSESGYFDLLSYQKPFLHLWSLAIEGQFYLFWPILFLYLINKPRLLKLLTASLFMASLSAYLVLSQTAISSTFFNPFTRIWELLLGGLIALPSIRKTKKLDTSKLIQTSFRFPTVSKNINNAFMPLVGVILIAFSFFFVKESDKSPAWNSLLSVIGTALIIFFVNKESLVSKILSNRLFVSIGLISYPLYLWHWPILSLSRILFGKELSVTLTLSLLFVSFVLSWLTFNFIEKLLRKKVSSRKSLILLAIWTVTICLFAALVVVTKGLPNRPAGQYPDNSSELIRLSKTDSTCEDYFTNLITPPPTYCKYIDLGATRTIAVIGDSHAHVSFPGISFYSQKNGKNTLLLANSSCPVLIGLALVATKEEEENCQKYILRIIEVISRDSKVDKVIIIQRGPYYWTKIEPISGKELRPILRDITVKDYFSYLQLTVDSLKKAKKDVIIVSENPELSIHPSACTPRPLVKRNESCFPLTDEVKLRFREYRAGLGKVEKVKIIDVTNEFCDINRCRITDSDNKLLYADDDHLSVAGSLFLAKFIFRNFDS